MERQDQECIWTRGLKTICGHHKKSLLDYVDAMEAQCPSARDVLGKIKAKIHNDLSQAQLSIGILFETQRSGGNIKPFEDSFREGTPYQNQPTRKPQPVNQNGPKPQPVVAGVK